MAKFRKKPVVIDAEQFDPSNGRPWPFGCVQFHARCEDERAACSFDGKHYIDTLEGRHIVTPGDFVIRGVKGEFYACKPDIFAMTYEPVIEPVAGASPLVNALAGH